MKNDLGRLLVESGQWKVHEMVLTLSKTEWLWKQMKRYKSLFNDITRGSEENFASLIALEDSFWCEVINQSGECVGIVYWTGMGKLIDADVHLIFFDRRPAEKVELCKEIARWFFKENPQANRMTATLPQIYYATIRLAYRIGFKHEGRKRESQMMGGKMVDEFILGILAKEIL
jgi:hypothetical protein